jgi:hypothetical protein
MKNRLELFISLYYNVECCDMTYNEMGDCCSMKQVTFMENVRFKKPGDKSLYILRCALSVCVE